MTGKYQITVGDVSREFEINDGDGLLMFHFSNDGSDPKPLFVGQADVRDVLFACDICLKMIAGSITTEQDDGQEE